jgi:hypothetical protein
MGACHQVIGGPKRAIGIGRDDQACARADAVGVRGNLFQLLVSRDLLLEQPDQPDRRLGSKLAQILLE